MSPLPDPDMAVIVERISDWAIAQSEIRLVLVVGARARQSPPPDRWSDLDLSLFCTDFNRLVSDPGWLECIGEVWVWLPEAMAEGLPQLLVLFEGGVKVDFGFFPLHIVEAFAASRRLDVLHDRGFYPLVDKDGWARRLPAPTRRPSQPGSPSEADFRSVVNAFLYGAVYVAKQIRRRNLWVVKYRDWTMKTHLLQMMAWHARALHGPAYDTLHDGHALSLWTDAQTWADLHHAFGGFGVSESWRALFGSLNLFRRLATHTALCLGFDYPTRLDRKITTYVEDLFNEMAED